MEKYWTDWENIKKWIIQKYEIKIIDHEEIRKIIKLKTDQGTMALKKVRASYDRFLFICEAMEHGRTMGFSNIPPVIQTINGQKGIEGKNEIYMLSRWIDGRESDYQDDLDLELATAALGRFHRASVGLEPSSNTNPRILWGKWIQNFHIRSKEMLMFRNLAVNKEQKTEFDQKIIHYTDYFYDWAVKSIGHLENSHYHQLSEMGRKTKTFCHHDMANHNVLLTKENDVYLIDFDYCIMDITTHDLSSFLIRNVRYGHWNLDRAYFILNIYNSVKPIMAQEIGVIKGFMEFPQEFWQIGLQYYMEKQPWEEEVFNRRLDRILDDIPKREVFMKRFLV